MTLDVTLFHESKDFVKSSHRSLYPVSIPLQHYQLRHFISTSEDGYIYYAAREEVFALHLATGKRERIATLAFVAQCLGAAFGWVCVGGITGRCIFIDVRERSQSVDELLPLNLDPNARLGDEPQDLNTHRPIRPRVYPHHVSTDYINSIALFRLASEEKGFDDEEVALISTNDHSVEIFSLRQLKIITSLAFPVNMNHASISPDGKLMIACGDLPRAYFLRRVRLPGHTEDGEFCYAKYEWKEFAQVKLMATESGDTCFSTAFSPSGHVCSIASQFGVVTVFDVNRIVEGMEDEDAVIDSFTSSRPAPVEEIGSWMPGAVRSSAFSPEPWDLFAWAEDRGRVCIADLRDGFRTRQLLELDATSPELERLEISDIEDQSIAELRELEIQASLLRRHRDTLAAHEQLAALQNTADYVENAAERRRRQREFANNLWASSSSRDSEDGALTETERQILETLRTERQQDANSQGDDRGPFSVHYPSGSSSRGYNPNVSVRQYMRERSNTASRDNQSTRTHGPRRRSSVVISGTRGESQDQPAASSSSAHPSSLLPITGSSTLSTSPSRLATATSTRSSGQSSPEPTPPSTSGSDAAWRTISAAMANASQSSPSAGSSDRRTLIQRQLLLDEQPNPDRRRVSRQRELDLARAQVLALSSATLERDSEANSSSLPPTITTSGPSTSSDTDTRAALRLQRERTRRQQVEQLLAEYRALQRQGLEAQERSGLDPGRQMRRWQERAQLADDRLPGVAAAAASVAATGLGGGGSGLGYGREMDVNVATLNARDRESGVAVMGLGWSNDGRTLFIGTEEGIFKLHVDVHSRKCFPAVQPR